MESSSLINLAFVLKVIICVTTTSKVNIDKDIQTSFQYLRNYTVISSPYIRHASHLMTTNFSAFSKTIYLTLTKDNSMDLSSSHLTVNGNVLPKVQTDRIMREALLLKGYDSSFPYSSFAYGKLYQNTYDGYISYENEIYFVEPLAKYLPAVDKSIVYRKSDFVENYRLSIIDFLDAKYAVGESSQHMESMESEYHGKSSPYKSKRSSDPVARSCSLHVVADPRFYNVIGGSSLSKTITEMRYQVGQADMIFRSTDFDGNGYGDNIGFEISNITVFTDPTYSGYYMVDNDLSVQNYLTLFSQYDFGQYCLGVAFTYRDFYKGVVGLAWIASSSIYGPPGGICQKQIKSSGKWYSYNTALVTMVNYGERLTSYKSSIVLTHEFGHNFGSIHDPKSDSSCVSSIYGNYIMYPYASSGARPNENRFSQCSINTMYPVIINKGSCFADRSVPSCGNGIMEPGEECDCGSSFTCAYTDNCCTPSDVTNSSDAPCTLRRSQGSVCSPKTGICCEKSCTLTPVYANRICGFSYECQESMICDGHSSNCPLPIPKPDTTLCDSERKLCQNGTCVKSICEKYNLVECQCTYVYEDTCKLCCRFPNTTNCITANNFGILSSTGGIIRLASGAPCNDFEGICDAHYTCISGDTSDIIERLKKVFTPYAGQIISSWLKNNWYYIFFGLLTLILLIILFLGCRGQNEDVQGRAYRQGRFEQVMAQARIERERQERKMSLLATMYDKKIRKVHNGHEQFEYTFALVRLSVFFPTVTKEVIQDTLSSSTSEEVAVRGLLIRGYPMRRMIYTNDIN